MLVSKFQPGKRMKMMMGFGGRLSLFLLLVFVSSSCARKLITFPDHEMVVIQSTEDMSMVLDDYPAPGASHRHDPPTHPPHHNGESGKVDGDNDNGDSGMSMVLDDYPAQSASHRHDPPSHPPPHNSESDMSIVLDDYPGPGANPRHDPPPPHPPTYNGETSKVTDDDDDGA